MRIAVAHNYYLQPGGEDIVVENESGLLENHGHDVLRIFVSNEDVRSYSRLTLAGRTLWNNKQYRDLRGLFRAKRPDVVHVHNTLPLISPSIYYAASAEKIPVVQMLHNYRPFCLNGVLFKDGQVCEDCIGKYPVPGVRHRCYRGSVSASLGVFALYMVHFEILRSYQRHISLFVTSTQFAKNLFVRMGLDRDKIVVKPNLVNLTDIPDRDQLAACEGETALYVGRLDVRKGLWTLLHAIEKTYTPLILVGDGVLRPEIEKWLIDRQIRNVDITGWLGARQVAGLMAKASMLILPSEFYESFGNVIVEAFAKGVPVVTTNIGGQSDLVTDGENGFLFPPGDSDALAQIIRKMNDNPDLRIKMGMNARKEFDAKYTVERNYQMLMDIYSRVMEGCEP